MNDEIYLHRVRYEHFYNGVLTFDIHYCNYDCLFCFAKDFRYEIEDKLGRNTNNLFEVKLDNIKYDKQENKLHLIGPDSEKASNFIDCDFGKGDKHNNLIKKAQISNCVIITSVSTLVLKFNEIFYNLFPNLKTIRFSGGENLHLSFLPFLNSFIIDLSEKIKKDIIIIIETNGARFDISSNDKDIKEFIKIINDEKYKQKIHIRISLKNPTDEFYEVLTRYGKNQQLSNAIDFGLYCNNNKISFHFTIIANFLSIDDLITFRNKIFHKIKGNDHKLKEKIFSEIIGHLEFERLFFCESIFKEYIVAEDILKNQGQSNELKVLLEDNIWKKKYNKFKNHYDKLAFSNAHRAYYHRFFNRIIPKFNILSDNIFLEDLIQYKKLIKLFTESGSSSLIKNYNFLKNTKNEFSGYAGIQKFWQMLYKNRFFLPNFEEFELSNTFLFKNISIIDRIPLYPGIFYLYDFWNQSHPNFFIYTLYSERKFLKIKKNGTYSNFYVFSINNNPNTHAHTDISRAIPFFIEDKSTNKNLIKQIIQEQVIDVDLIKLKLCDIRNYLVVFNKFQLSVPLLIVEFKELGSIEETKTPFLGSIGALYNRKNDFKDFYFLNYFIWTGINNLIEIGNLKTNHSFKKAFDYLYNFKSLSKSGSLKIKWLDLNFIEPKDEIMDLLNITNEFNSINIKDKNNLIKFMSEISTRKKEIKSRLETFNG